LAGVSLAEAGEIQSVAGDKLLVAYEQQLKVDDILPMVYARQCLGGGL